MSDEFSQIIDHLNARTPQARLERHKAFWGDNPDPAIAARLQAVERLIVDGKACRKALSILKDLDKARIDAEWSTDIDAIEGGLSREDQRSAGVLSAESRKKSVGWERELLNSIVERLAKRRDALGDYIPPSELWEPLFGEMDAERLRPSEEELLSPRARGLRKTIAEQRADKKMKVYIYADDRRYTYCAFESQLRRIRKNQAPQTPQPEPDETLADRIKKLDSYLADKQKRRNQNKLKK